MLLIRLASLPALLSTVAILSACSVGDVDEDADDSDPELEFRADDVPPSQVENACWAVAVLTPSCTDPAQCPASWTCPATLGTGWDRAGTGAMFDDGTNAIAAVGITPSDLPPHLRRFCLYRGSPDAGDPLGPQQQGGLPYSKDCPALQSMGSALTTPLQDEFQAAFEAHAGGSPSSIALGGNDVRVAIVDSHSSRSTAAFQSPHAPSMAAIVEELACNGTAAGCKVQTDYALALPLTDAGDLKDPEGGVYGTRAHLAIGIIEAVMDWKKDGMVGPLVINLSLGWNAQGTDLGDSEANPWFTDHVGGFTSTVTAHAFPPAYESQYAVESVHAALMYASCHGATIIAAAGNGRSDACNDEPVAPAAWADYHAPHFAECQALGFNPPAAVAGRVPVSAAASWPLVTPVAAMNHLNHPIVATRPSSRTVLMGPGFHATADAAMDPMTGTSAAAATVTSAAALVLSHNPTWTTKQVVDRLWTQGRSTGYGSEMPQYLPPGTSVRVPLLCRAQPTPTCSVTQYQTRLTAALDLLRNQTLATLSALPPGVDVFTLPSGSFEDSCGVCSEDARFFGDPNPEPGIASLLPVEACEMYPTTFEFDENPTLAGPQPTPRPCPVCPVVYTTSSGNTKATLSIADDYTMGPDEWTGANLVFTHSDRSQSVFDLSSFADLAVLRDRDQVVVDLGTRLAGGPTIVAVTFNLNLTRGSDGEGYTRSNELTFTIN